MGLINNKKGQWARAAARDRRTQERNLRKTLARVLKLLGFNTNEMVDFLNVSTQTVKTYLRETEDVVYSDLADQIYKQDIFNLFTIKEQELLNRFKELSSLSQSLSHDSERNHKIIHKKNIIGWFVHKFGDVNKYKKQEEETSKEISKIEKESHEISKKFSDKNLCPHLSKSSLNFKVKRERKWICEFCGKQFNTKEEAEAHESNCDKK